MSSHSPLLDGYDLSRLRLPERVVMAPAVPKPMGGYGGDAAGYVGYPLLWQVHE